MDKEKSIVYICAHPDDIVSVAGTLLLLRRKGCRIYDFCLTRGQKGSPDPNIGMIRSEEERKVCDILGADLRFFEQMDGELYANRDVCNAVAHDLAEIKPDAVITHWAFEKADHCAAYSIAHKAMHLADLYWTTEFYMSQVEGNNYMFDPDLYVNVSEVMDDVRKITECYSSRWDEAMVNHFLHFKEVYGMSSWCNNAEAFMLTLPLQNERWNRKPEVGRILYDL